jgi:hypothetical protein
MNHGRQGHRGFTRRRRKLPAAEEFKLSVPTAFIIARAAIRKRSGPKRLKTFIGSSLGKRCCGNLLGPNGSSAASSAHNCLDRHVTRAQEQGGYHLGRPGDKRVLTIAMSGASNKFANVLKKLGVKKGDRVCLYMGMVPELVIMRL